MQLYPIQFMFVASLILLPVIDVLLTRRRYGIRHRSTFSGVILASLLTVSTLSFQPVENNIGDMISWFLVLSALIVLGILFRVFGSQTYKVSDAAGFDLSKNLKRAIESTGLTLSTIEVREENRKSTFQIENTKMTIEVELKERLVFKETYFNLTFKGIANRHYRQPILDYLSEQMSLIELPKKKYSIIVIEALMFLVVLVILMGIINTRLLQEMPYASFDAKGMSTSIEVITYDQNVFTTKENKVLRIDNTNKIEAFYRAFSQQESYFTKFMNVTDVSSSAYYEIIFGSPTQSLYVNSYGAHLYNPYDSLAKSSPIKHMMVSFYNLYGKREGNVYRLYDDQDAAEMIRTIFGVR